MSDAIALVIAGIVISALVIYTAYRYKGNDDEEEFHQKVAYAMFAARILWSIVDGMDEAKASYITRDEIVRSIESFLQAASQKYGGA